MIMHLDKAFSSVFSNRTNVKFALQTILLISKSLHIGFFFALKSQFNGFGTGNTAWGTISQNSNPVFQLTSKLPAKYVSSQICNFLSNFVCFVLHSTIVFVHVHSYKRNEYAFVSVIPSLVDYYTYYYYTLITIFISSYSIFMSRLLLPCSCLFVYIYNS